MFTFLVQHVNMLMFATVITVAQNTEVEGDGKGNGNNGNGISFAGL